MAAPKGNNYWEARLSHGRKPIYPATPDGAKQLWNDCCEYFQWVEDNPLMTAELVKFQGEAKIAEYPVKRAMLIESLCDYLGIMPETWRDWRSNRKDLSVVITRAERVIYRQKFEGAAANQLNPNIIARDLGLADKREITGADGGAIKTITGDMTPQEAAEEYARTLRPE